MEERDLVVIGGGVAGVTATIYAKRALLDVLLISEGPLGGQLLNTDKISNWPGESEITGVELAEKFKNHVIKLGVDLMEFTNIESIDLENKIIKTMWNTIKTKAIIIATGETPKMLGVKGEEKFRGKGVSYCAVCDGAFFANKSIFVVGGGNSAFQESLYLARFASEITLIHRRDEFRAEPALIKEVESNSKIKLMTSSIIEEIKGDEKVNSVLVKDLKNNAYKEIPTDGVFIFIGETPNSTMFDVEKDERGYIKVDEHMRTNRAGVFAAGDVATTPLKQLIVAAGTGAIAGISAYKHIKGLKI